MEVVTVLEPQVAHGAALGGVPVYLPELDDARKEMRIADVCEYVARHAGAATSPAIHMGFGPVADGVEFSGIREARWRVIA